MMSGRCPISSSLYGTCPSIGCATCWCWTSCWTAAEKEKQLGLDKPAPEVFDNSTHSLHLPKIGAKKTDASSSVPNLLRDLLHCSGGPWSLAKSTTLYTHHFELSNIIQHLPLCVWMDRHSLVKRSAFLPLRNRHGGHLRMIAHGPFGLSREQPLAKQGLTSWVTKKLFLTAGKLTRA